MATAGALQDATFKTKGAGSDFNNKDNWEEGYVPTGIATIPQGFIGPITFSKPATTFATFKTLAYTGFIIAAGQTVTLTGAGVVTPEKGTPEFGVFGTLEGQVRLDGTQANASKLYGTGTIKGSVENIGGTVNPGSSYGGSGTLTIDGSYLQKSGGPDKFTNLNIGAVPGRPSARLTVTGRVQLSEDNSGLVIIMDNPAGVATNVTFIALSSGAGLNGVFGAVSCTRPQMPVVNYDANNVNVTV
ncbi:MAG: hypothetical protein EXR12_06010 [Rhodospirillaceae bacterium]|nr:hypothetical protein [Rhodospirillaceae bacterium]